jgi:fructose-1,6-bisphosphatase/inositol monophosphatase family enzyme
MTATRRHYLSGVSINASMTRDSSDEAILYALRNVANVAQLTIAAARDWSLTGAQQGQYAADVMVNDAVIAALREFGWGILSEESGSDGYSATTATDLGDQLVVIVDPIDGSTNASRGVAWHAVSLCCVDHAGPRVAVVVQLAQPHTEYAAIRGRGAWKNGERLRAPEARPFDKCVVGVSGPPPRNPGWWQFRANGAAALDLCLVADGGLDGYLDCDQHGVWDYAGAALVCAEVGVSIRDAQGRDLFPLQHGERRTPIAATSAEILERLVALRH